MTKRSRKLVTERKTPFTFMINVRDLENLDTLSSARKESKGSLIRDAVKQFLTSLE